MERRLKMPILRDGKVLVQRTFCILHLRLFTVLASKGRAGQKVKKTAGVSVAGRLCPLGQVAWVESVTAL